MLQKSGLKTKLNRTEQVIAIGSVIGLLLLAALFRYVSIGGAVNASGEVVVQGNPRPVQSVEGGIVRDIKVKNGDLVETGQVLLQLDPRLAEINRDIVHGVLTELTARKARLEAERLKLDEIPPVETEIALDPEAVHQSDLTGMRNAIQDAELKITQADQEFHDEVVSELRQVSAEIDENRLEFARLDEIISRLDNRAPVAGVVHELQVWTSGGVIAPQETLMTVVPVTDGLEFEVQVAPESIDTVHLGQTARLRFPSFDQRPPPELYGAVSRVSPDSVEDPETDRRFYWVEVTLRPEELARLGQSELIPGMPVEAFLHTGDRSVLSFLMKPLTDQLAHAFRESWPRIAFASVGRRCKHMT